MVEMILDMWARCHKYDLKDIFLSLQLDLSFIHTFILSLSNIQMTRDETRSRRVVVDIDGSKHFLSWHGITVKK